MTHTPTIHRSSWTVAIDVTPILPGGENGGAKVFILELIGGLARLLPKVQFLLLTHGRSHDELANLDYKNVRRIMAVEVPDSEDSQILLRRLHRNLIHRLPYSVRKKLAQLSYRVSDLRQASAETDVLRKAGADLLFCPFTAPTFFDRSIPAVCTIYDLQFAAYPYFFPPEEVAHREYVFVSACRKAAMLVSISDYSRDSAIAHGKLAPARIKTIPLRIARRIFPGESADTDILDRLGVPVRSYLLYPANFWKHKNHEMLLTAFSIACTKGLPQDLKLICTGSAGPRSDFIKGVTASIGLAHRVAFPGYLTDVELSALMRNASGLVFPSLYEGFGLPVLEAMATGVPVACSNVTSLPEVAGEAAIFFDPQKTMDIAQALLDLVLDKPLRCQLIEKGYRQAERYSDTGKMVSEYWSIFESVLCRY